MTHQERIELIREIKEIIKMQHDSEMISHKKIFDDEFIKTLKFTLENCIRLSGI